MQLGRNYLTEPFHLLRFWCFFVSQKRRSPGEGQQLYLYRTRTYSETSDQSHKQFYIHSEKKLNDTLQNDCQ